MATRLTFSIQLNGIPPEMIVNADQTGISLITMGNKTYAKKGAKQIKVAGKEEKRQLTLMVAVAASGHVLPFQAIYKGKTAQSLPCQSFQKPAEDLGFIFTPGGDNHWSTLVCVQEVPFICDDFVVAMTLNHFLIIVG